MEGDIGKAEVILALQTACETFFDKFKIEAVDNSMNYNIYIVIPEVILQNAVGKRHKLKEVLLSVNFQIQETITGDGELNLLPLIRLTRINRGTFTAAEKRNNYVHSHVSSSNNICYGSGPLSNFSATFATEFLKNPVLALESYFMNVIAFLEYESTNTAPYKTISALFLGRDKAYSIPKIFDSQIITMTGGGDYSIAANVEDNKLILDEAEVEEHFFNFVPPNYRIIVDSSGNIVRLESHHMSADTLEQPFQELLGREFEIIENYLALENYERRIHPHVLLLLKSRLTLKNVLR
jgi:hypothetical protein